MALGAEIWNLAMRSALLVHYVWVRWLRSLRAKAIVLMEQLKLQ